MSTGYATPYMPALASGIPGFMDNWGVPAAPTAPGISSYAAPVTGASAGYSAGVPSTMVSAANAAGGKSAGGFMGSGIPGADVASGVMQGIQTIANIWSAYQANKLAKKQFEFTKEVTNTNLNNTIKSYNTALSDRAVSRGHTQGNTAAEVAAYIAANQAKRG